MTTGARRAVLPLSLSVLVSLTAVLRAQDRFEVLSRDSVAQLPGLTIATIHDRRTDTCYALFSRTLAPPTPVGTSGAIRPRVVEPPNAARSRREAESQPAREPAPDSQARPTLPWSAPTSGTQTGGWEQLAESFRRALVDPTTARALSAPLGEALGSLDERLDRIEGLLQQAESRTFAAWPVSCDTSVSR